MNHLREPASRGEEFEEALAHGVRRGSPLNLLLDSFQDQCLHALITAGISGIHIIIKYTSEIILRYVIRDNIIHAKVPNSV